MNTENETNASDESRSIDGIVRSDFKFEHMSRNLTTFYAKDRTLVDGVYVKKGIDDLSEARLAQDVADFIGWHAVNVWPELNGFSGYDCVRFIFS